MAHIRIEEQINIGDEVTAASGPNMHVAEIHDGHAECAWLVHGEIRRGRFPLSDLQKIMPPKGPPFVIAKNAP